MTTDADADTAQPDRGTSIAKSVRAWDLPTRLFHWSLVVCIISSWVSYRYAEVLGDYTLRWHRWNGYAILVLIVFRVIWGFAGSSTSRWSAFLAKPLATLAYAKDLLRGRDRHFLGHNPLGTYMILGLLAVVGLQASLGLFTVEHNDSGADGPLYRLVSDANYKLISKWHRWVFYWVILPFVAVHITANTLYGLVKKDPLIRAMITGEKPAANYEDAPEAKIVRGVHLRAAVCLIAATGLVFGGIVLVGGRLT
jgi:cytochrome b